MTRLRQISVYLMVGLSALFGSWAYGQSLIDYEARITAEEWPDPAMFEQIIALPQIQEAVREYDMLEMPLLVIRYPGGDAGNFKANELLEILVSLGIELDSILLEPGSGEFDSLLIIVSEREG